MQARLPRVCPWHLLVLMAAFGALAGAPAARAQDDRATEDSPFQRHSAQTPETSPTTPSPVVADGPIAFEADQVEYHDKDDTVVAIGSVVLRQAGRSLRADTVTWNRTSGKIFATGNIRTVDEDGNQLFTDRMELTDKIETGTMDNMLLALREGGRLAASSGTRMGNGDVVLTHASYSACEIEDNDGCPKQPSWRITAAQVVYQQDQKSVRFRGARMELFGIRLLVPLPGLLIATDGRAISGPLTPYLRLSSANGVEIRQPYYLRLGNNRDRLSVHQGAADDFGAVSRAHE
jgi:LPS-assembly protein